MSDEPEQSAPALSAPEEGIQASASGDRWIVTPDGRWQYRFGNSITRIDVEIEWDRGLFTIR